MIVCDRHVRTKATGKITIESTDERYDLCDACLYAIYKFIGDKNASDVDEKNVRSLAKAG